MTTTNNFFTHKEHYLAFRAAWAKSFNNKDINMPAEYHIIYNILRGKAFDCGFTPITRTTKLQNGFYINQGLYFAMYEARLLVSDARSFKEGESIGVGLKRILEVFDGLVTVEMIASIELPEVVAMTPNYGKYRKVAELIIDKAPECKPHSFNDIDEILQEVA